MSDSLTSGQDASEQTPDGQSDQTSGTPQTNAAPANAGTPTDYVSRKDLQALQSLKDREIAQERAMRQQMQAQIDQLATRDMDDLQRMQYDRQKLINEINLRDQALGAMHGEIAREKLLGRIASKTKAPRDTLDDPTLGPDDVWEKAWDWAESHGGKKAPQSTDNRRSPGQVDLGSGSPPASNDLNARLAKAERDGDSLELARIMTEQRKSGFTGRAGARRSA